MSNKFTLSKKPFAEDVPASGSAGVILNGHYAGAPADGDGKIQVRTSALIQADAATLYALWRDTEQAPIWQEQVSSVTATGPKRSHWVMRSGKQTIEWDSEVLAEEPAKRIAWRSVAGDSQNAGEVIFDDAPGGRGTIVTVLQEFGMGKWTELWETLTGRNPKQAVIENLRHFKAFAETGEIPRIEPQPHGERGVIGKRKQSLYGETVEVPSGAKLTDL